jgi:ABC-2 type transport system permease protein
MRKVLAIGRVNTLRFLRERSNAFFVFVFPLLIVLLVGVVFSGEGNIRLGVYVAGEEGPLASKLVAAIEAVDRTKVTRFGSEGALVDGVQRGAVSGGVVIPADYDAVLAGGGSVEVGFVSRPEQSGMLLRETVLDVVSRQAEPIGAALFAQAQGAGSFSQALPVAEAAAGSGTRVTVSSSEAGKPLFEGIQGLGTFDMSATAELVLFMFLTSLTASADLILTRKLGVARRMLATPTPTRVILGGEVLGRLGVAVVQGLYIMLGTLIFFGVRWGDPLGAIALVLVFALVGSGAAMLMGSIFSNEQQAGGVGVLLGLGLAAVGGAMVPIELFPAAMKTVAKFTPQAWAMEGFAKLVRHHGSLIDILPQLGVLAAFAFVFMALATWRLRRVLTT